MHGERGRLSSALDEGGNGDGGGTARCGAHKPRSWQRAQRFSDVERKRALDCGLGAQGDKKGEVMQGSQSE